MIDDNDLRVISSSKGGCHLKV